MDRIFKVIHLDNMANLCEDKDDGKLIEHTRKDRTMKRQAIAMLVSNDIPYVASMTVEEKVEEYAKEYGHCDLTTRNDPRWGIVYECRFNLHNGEPYQIDWINWRTQ